MSNFRSNARILILRLFTGMAINNLKKSKKNLHRLHIVNEGISDDALHRMIFRDSQEEVKKVMDMLCKLKKEKTKRKPRVVMKETLCS
ncbi:MAG: hypothetical protein Q8O88_04285 [bacterium]|nr:hypothetical protein [bacterium]